jgi:hydrogenase maturation protease
MKGGGIPLALIVGIGNPDRGDDGVGPAVARRLRSRVPASVRVLECSGDALTLLDDWEGFGSVILVDAVTPIDAPGRVHRVDLAKNPLPLAFSPPSTHALGLAEAIELARCLGRLPRYIAAYLVEGEQFDTGSQLSPMVAKALDGVLEAIITDIPGALKAWTDDA